MSGKAQNVQANQGSWVTLSRRLRLRSSTQPTGETDLTARKQTSVKTRRGAQTCALSQVTCALSQGWRLEHNGNQGGFCCSVIGEKRAGFAVPLLVKKGRVLLFRYW